MCEAKAKAAREGDEEKGEEETDDVVGAEADAVPDVGVFSGEAGWEEDVFGDG